MLTDHINNFFRARVRFRSSNIYRVAQKIGTLFVCLITSSNIDQFSNVFHRENQEKICNNTITKDSMRPQMCCYTTL